MDNLDKATHIARFSLHYKGGRVTDYTPAWEDLDFPIEGRGSDGIVSEEVARRETNRKFEEMQDLFGDNVRYVCLVRN